MTCPACGVTAGPAARFCAQCGAALVATCPGCGSPRVDGARFCASCGTALGPEPRDLPAKGAAPSAPVTGRVAERRLVTVLFADLVGFTTLAESRDAEEVRELLSHYFEICRTLVSRHGGVVEKFIGDAVMAVWGAPVANEDDAERAVRSALELVVAVQAMGEDVGAAGLRVRAGVLTGEAAVSLGATGEGLVAGDLVNTASRIQSVASPGSVLVGEATRRATDAAVRYEPAGFHELKGKAEPLALFRALQVVAGRSGSMRVEGLEAPFVGRDRELRMLKDLFHSSADHRTPQLVTVTGIAGVGKSRLSWEFEKYVDGLASDVWWHRGRCLSYGDGVTYWALADMMRMRVGSVEGEAPEAVAAKLADTVARFVPDPAERRWIEPRLGQLLGLGDRPTTGQDDQFAAWRLFVERMSDVAPVVLVFEDLHWADTSLLDFVDYLLEWSRGHPIFVLALSRPELAERRPTWGTGRRNFSSLYLEPLTSEAMEQLLAGLVPGLPPSVAATILARAEGIPLYAVETVRMLLDQGLLEQVDDRYRPTGPIDDLQVPETLHGLIAARLDGLAPAERRLVEDAAVLGKSFTPAALAAVSGLPVEGLRDPLGVLVRREVLTVTSDPRSPERGQYEFVQDLLRKVAYETLSRHDRKAKHLAVAAYLQTEGENDEDDVVELIAAHYVDALRSDPDAADAPQTRARARAMLVRAGDRAVMLAAPAESLRYFTQALDFTDDVLGRARLDERAGQAAAIAGRFPETRSHMDRAIAAFESQGQVHAAARVSARLAEIDFYEGSLTAAITRMQAALEVLSSDPVDADIAEVSAQLARLLFFVGRSTEALPHLEIALAAAERLALPETLAQALNTKSLVLLASRRPTESDALLEKALSIALAGDLHEAALRAYFNLAERRTDTGRIDEALEIYRVALAHARRVGDTFYDLSMQAGSITPLLTLGRWDEALATADAVTADEHVGTLQLVVVELVPAAAALVRRGEVAAAREFLSRLPDAVDSENVQNRAAQQGVLAAIARADGDAAQALKLARLALASWADLGLIARAPVDGFVEALEAAFDLGDDESIDELLAFAEGRPRGEILEFLDGQRLRFGARRSSARGADEEAVTAFEAAIDRFHDTGHVYWQAMTRLETAQHHVARRRPEAAEPLLAQAREGFQALRARPALELVAALERQTGQRDVATAG
jgi:class 3 adenylate cyclase/tetratricopeptide (TPR) repeat protein